MTDPDGPEPTPTGPPIPQEAPVTPPPPEIAPNPSPVESPQSQPFHGDPGDSRPHDQAARSSHGARDTG